MFDVGLSNQNVEVVELQDSQFTGAWRNFSPMTYGGQTLSVTNSLFQDCSVGAYKNYSGQAKVALRNNLFHRGGLTLYYYYVESYGTPQWVCTDNLFDGVSVSAYSITTNRLYAGWNGYSATSATFGGTSNRVSLSAVFLAGPLGGFYYPSSGGGNTLAVFAMLAGGLAAVVAGCMMVTLYVWPRVPALYTT